MVVLAGCHLLVCTVVAAGDRAADTTASWEAARFTDVRGLVDTAQHVVFEVLLAENGGVVGAAHRPRTDASAVWRSTVMVGGAVLEEVAESAFLACMSARGRAVSLKNICPRRHWLVVSTARVVERCVCHDLITKAGAQVLKTKSAHN